VLSALSDTVTVMYAGRIVEAGPAAEVVRRTRHPYTRGLLDSLPHPDRVDQPLVPISGMPPNPADRPSGCAFHPRCAHATEVCHLEIPALLQVAPGHQIACPVDPLVRVAESVA
jgi:oligopeptide/dipeptide ABC transporter ATP-binding protein